MRINKQSIAIAFEGDKDIFIYCDPEFANSSLEQLVDSIYQKIADYPSYFKKCFFENLVVDSNTVGFICYTKSPNMLVSFGVNINYRSKEILEDVFSVIKEKFDGDSFTSLMWARNTRAIKWLEKNGMKIEPFEHKNLVKLKY